MAQRFKKLWWLLSVLFLLPMGTAFGQPGIKGGLVLSGFQPWQDLRPFLGNDYRPFLGYEVDWVQDKSYPDIGWQIGIFYTGNISRYFAIQPELHYSQRGIHFYQTELYNTSYSLNVSYLELPLLIGYKIPFKWSVRPSLLFGPYAALKLSASQTVKIWEEQETSSVSSINNLDYGLVFAVSSEFTAWSRPVILELRLNWGLASIMEQPTDYTDLFKDAGRVNILALTLMTGFRF